MSQVQEFHILRVTDKSGERTYQLTAAAYSIGRDSSSNSIKIDDASASRNHAILLRMPHKNNTYIYRIIDGDLRGKRSTNGLLVNDQPCFEKNIKTGDQIRIGESVKMSYMVANMTQADCDEFFRATSPEFQSLKEESHDPRGTLDSLTSGKIDNPQDMMTSIMNPR